MEDFLDFVLTDIVGGSTGENWQTLYYRAAISGSLLLTRWHEDRQSISISLIAPQQYLLGTSPRE